MADSVIELGQVSVVINNPNPIDALATEAVERLIGVADSTNPELKKQVEIFKAQTHAIFVYYMNKAVDLAEGKDAN